MEGVFFDGVFLLGVFLLVLKLLILGLHHFFWFNYYDSRWSAENHI